MLGSRGGGGGVLNNDKHGDGTMGAWAETAGKGQVTYRDSTQLNS